MRSITLLLALFALSVLVRAPNLDKPLGGQFEILTAHTLITLQIWHDNGIEHYRYSPAYTFNSDQDRHIQSLTSGIKDEAGNFYYVSYPPFAFLFPFYTFKLLSIDPSILSLRLLNVALHFFTALLLYLFVCSIYRREFRAGLFFPAVVAYAAYLFSPGNLWYHSNVYFVDILVQPLWIAGLLLAFLTFRDRKTGDRRYLAGLGVVVFLATYTEWLGLFFAFVLALVSLYRMRYDRSFANIFLAVAIGSLAALTLTLLQYASINDLKTLLDASVERYIRRSGYNGAVGWFYEWRGHYFVFLHYLKMHSPVLGLLAFVSIAFFSKYRPGRKFDSSKSERLALLFCLAPVLLHHLVFFDYTVIHEFSTVKSSVPISVLTAVLLQLSLQMQDEREMQFFKRLVSVIAVVLLLFGPVVYYKNFALPERFPQQEFARLIQRTAAPDETIFIETKSSIRHTVYQTHNDIAVDAQLQYYTRRNIALCSNREAAVDFLEKHDLTKGIIYRLNVQGEFISLEHVDLQFE